MRNLPPSEIPEDEEARPGHWARLAAWGVGGALGGLLLILGFDLLRPLFTEVRRGIVRSPEKVALVAALLVLISPRVALPLPRRFRAFADDLADRALGGPLAVAIASACSALLLTWVPHYLTWPWFADADQFSVSAQSWDAGLVPYRDLPDFDFPGPIYLFYLLGKVFGWGRTASFYALDAAFLVALGVALAAWSRRIFGGMLPGLVGYLPMLCLYLSFDYIQVAQRDWHGPFFTILALLALEAVPGRAGRLASAASLALALAFRPHVVLFFPAIVLAVDEGSRREGEPWTRLILPLLEWSAAFALALVLAFLPLIVPGAFDDFLRRLSVAHYGGSYNHATWARFAADLGGELVSPWTVAVLAAVGWLSLFGPMPIRRPARTWTLALAGALFYKPISPVLHTYLDQPLFLFRSLALAPIVAWLLATPRLVAPLRLSAVLALIVVAIPQVRVECSVSRSLRAIGTLARGEDPISPPTGCRRYFINGGRPNLHYRWDDYRRVLAYLRAEVSPETRVANFLRAHPFPTVNGPTGHLNTFPAAGGLIHLCSVEPQKEAAFVEALEETRDSVVVWVPGETRVDPRLVLPRMVEVIRSHYRPEARFGDIEVWRHGG